MTGTTGTPGSREDGPVAVGGLGGSGTRVVAQWLADLGHEIGPDHNRALDNLWFTLLLRRRSLGAAEQAAALEVFLHAMRGGSVLDAGSLRVVGAAAASAARGRENVGPHPAGWAAKRVASLLRARRTVEAGGPWGWKEPNTHVRLPLLCATIPGLRYVHMLRNGLDMVYSRNQNQLRWWGPHFGVDVADEQALPRASLQYWAATTRRAQEIGARELGDRFLLLRFEDLCEQPAREAARFLRFLGRDPDPTTVSRLAAVVHVPPSLGRHRGTDLSQFRHQDLEVLEDVGYRASSATPAAPGPDAPTESARPSPRSADADRPQHDL